MTRSENDTAKTAKHRNSSLWFLTVMGFPKSAGIQALEGKSESEKEKWKKRRKTKNK